MKSETESTGPAATVSPPCFYPDRALMLRWQEPREYVRRRAAREIARLSRRERFLLTYCVLIATLLGWAAQLFFPAATNGHSFAASLGVGVLGSAAMHIMIFRFPLWYPVSVISFNQRGLVRQNQQGAIFHRYDKFASYQLLECDGFSLMYLRYNDDHELKNTFLGILKKPKGDIEIALPDACWHEVVAQAFRMAGVPAIGRRIV